MEKNFKFGTKNALLKYSWDGIWKKTIVIFEISTLKPVKDNFLTNTVNFAIGSGFSEGLGLGLGPLYTVCPFEFSLSD